MTVVTQGGCKASNHFSIYLYYFPFCPVCYKGDIRLLGGQNAAEGTVELCAINQWIAICGQFWTTNDAKVVCRQLGFNNSEFNSHTCVQS